jgi:hypothetical protein
MRKKHAHEVYGAPAPLGSAAVWLHVSGGPSALVWQLANGVLQTADGDVPM